MNFLKKHVASLLIILTCTFAAFAVVGWTKISGALEQQRDSLQLFSELKVEIDKTTALLEAVENIYTFDAQLAGDQDHLIDTLSIISESVLSDIENNINMPRGNSSVIPHLWLPGSTITISFMDGSVNQREKVAEVAQTWTEHANINFKFVDFEGAVRISFEGMTNSSLVGAYALRQNTRRPTMRLASVRDEAQATEIEVKAILHEFGHMLGLIHEHQSPKSPIVWNEKEVKKFYERVARRTARFDPTKSVLKKFDAEKYQYYRDFDPFSVMNYDFPRDLIQEGPEILRSTGLSPSDVEFVRRLYP